MKVDLRSLAMFAMGALSTSPATASADDQQDLAGAIENASPGDTIELPGGHYGSVAISDVTAGGANGRVTVTSEDPSDPAIFGGLDIRGSEGLAFNGVVFDYEFSQGEAKHLRPFQVIGSRNVSISGSRFIGDNPEGVSKMDDAHGWAVGAHVEGSKGVTLSGNHISGFMRGLLVRDTDAITVSHNEIEDIRSDGMNFVAVEGALIEDNYIHDFSRALESKDHADMIQFWTRNTDRPSSDVTLRGNVLLSGNGDATQSIFMRNDMVDRGVAGREMFYEDITIEENVIVNGHLHGISLGESEGVSINNNTLLRSPAFAEGEMEERSVFVPKINLAATSQDVRIADNIAGGFPEPAQGWTMVGNVEVQDVSVMRPNYYHGLFADALSGNPADLESFAYQPDLMNLRPDRTTGASRLMPTADRSAFIR